MDSNSSIIRKKIFSKINSIEATELVQELVRIPSVNPPGDEYEVAKFMEKNLSEIGLDVNTQQSYPGRPNVLGRLKGRKGSPILMLNGHLDVVPPGNNELWTVEPFGGELRKGRVYGRGSADMKGGLAAMILAAKAIKESNLILKGDLLLSCVVDEEVSGKGARDLINQGPTADMAIIAEPTGLQLFRAHKGIIWFKISTQGHSIHSCAVSSQGKAGEVNAIYKMVSIIEAIQKYQIELEKRVDNLVGHPTVSIGTISGGSKTNIVPDKCSITVDRRLIPGENPIKVQAEIKDILNKIMEEDSSMKIESKVILSREGSVISEDDLIVSLSKQAMESVLGANVSVSGYAATCDMEIFVNQGNIPTVILGPGSLSSAHSIDENVEIKQVVNAAKIFSLIASKILG
jgi:succinyl-diaminopimelate desuccinylase